jgi:hypothetical protein
MALLGAGCKGRELVLVESGECSSACRTVSGKALSLMQWPATKCALPPPLLQVHNEKKSMAAWVARAAAGVAEAAARAPARAEALKQVRQQQRQPAGTAVLAC